MIKLVLIIRLLIMQIKAGQCEGTSLNKGLCIFTVRRVKADIIVRNLFIIYREWTGLQVVVITSQRGSSEEVQPQEKCNRDLLYQPNQLFYQLQR